MDHGAQGLLAYAVHPGGVRTDMGYRLSTELQEFLNDTPELAGDTIAFLTRERREWLSGRYISCECLHVGTGCEYVVATADFSPHRYLGHGGVLVEARRDCERRQAEGPDDRVV